MLLLLFTVVPFVELYLLLWVSDRIGFSSTVLLVLVTGVVGAALAKAEGVRVMRRWQAALADGRVPEEGVVHGAIALVGGALLITPGVLTDVVGLLLLLPATRRWLGYFVKVRLGKHVRESGVHVVGFHTSSEPPFHASRQPPRPPPRHEQVDVIDTDGHTVERQDATPTRPLRRIS